MMHWSTFRNQFIVNFLATWTAGNHASACAEGSHERLEKPPCEDAAFLAEKAWKELANTGVSKKFPVDHYNKEQSWPESHYLSVGIDGS